MSISHWGIVPGWFLASWHNGRDQPAGAPEWEPADFTRWCRYWYGTENEP